MLKRILSALGGLLVGLLILEILLRGFGAVVAAKDQQRTSAEDLGSWRVLCLGACYTIGLGTAPSESYPSQLEAMLKQAHPEASPSVINGGIRSKSIDYFADRIDGLVELFEPQVVVVNINDRMAYDAEELAAAQQHRSPIRSALSDLRLVRLVRLARTGPQSSAMDSELWWEGMAFEVGQPARDPYARRIEMFQHEQGALPRDRMARKRLVELYIERSDYASALETLEKMRPRGRAIQPHSLERFRCAVALGRYEDAAGDLSRASAPWYIEEYRGLIGEPPGPEDGEDATNQYRLDEAYLALLEGEYARAQGLLEELLSRDPDFARAYPVLGFVRWRTGEQDGLSASEAFMTRPERAARAQNGYGLVSKDSDELIADDEAARRFEVLLDLHLTTIQEAAEEQGAVVILENLSTLPFQQEIIARLAAEHGLPLVDLQGGLVAHPDRERLFHPTQHLRLSAAGNAWIAEEIFAALKEADALPE